MIYQSIVYVYCLCFCYRGARAFMTANVNYRLFETTRNHQINRTHYTRSKAFIDFRGTACTQPDTVAGSMHIYSSFAAWQQTEKKEKGITQQTYVPLTTLWWTIFTVPGDKKHFLQEFTGTKSILFEPRNENIITSITHSSSAFRSFVQKLQAADWFFENKNIKLSVVSLSSSYLPVGMFGLSVLVCWWVAWCKFRQEDYRNLRY